MAQQKQVSAKRIKVDKTQARIMALVAGSAFLVVFSLVASFALFKQLTYQNRVISAKKAAVAQLESNLSASDSLVTSYQTFADAPQNLIGGDPTGTGPQDGSNPKLVLDALPSKYDFPALTASLEKLINDHKGKIQTITGTDDEVAQSVVNSDGSPQSVEMPLDVSVEAAYGDVQGIVAAMERSIRPFQFVKMETTGDQANMTLKFTVKTFYQPEKTLNIKTETVK